MKYIVFFLELLYTIKPYHWFRVKKYWEKQLWRSCIFSEVAYHWTASLLKMLHFYSCFFQHFAIVKQWVALYMGIWIGVSCSMFSNDTISFKFQCYLLIVTDTMSNCQGTAPSGELK